MKKLNDENQIQQLRREMKQLDISMRKRIDKRFKRITEYLDFRLQPLDSIEKRLDRLEHTVYDKLDWLVGAFKKFDETHSILDHQQKEQKLQLENHEYRIEDLEKTKSN